MRGPPWARGGPSGPVGQPPRAAAEAQGPGGGILAKRWSEPRSPTMVYMHPALEPAMSVQTAIRLPEDLHKRFVALSRKTGRTAAFYMREALQRQRDSSLADRCSLTLHLVWLRIACRWAMRLAIRLRPDSAMTPRPCPARSHWLPRLRSLPAATPCRTGAGEGCCCCCETQYGVAGCSPSRISGPPQFSLQESRLPHCPLRVGDRWARLGCRCLACSAERQHPRQLPCSRSGADQITPEEPWAFAMWTDDSRRRPFRNKILRARLIGTISAAQGPAPCNNPEPRQRSRTDRNRPRPVLNGSALNGQPVAR